MVSLQRSLPARTPASINRFERPHQTLSWARKTQLKGNRFEFFNFPNHPVFGNPGAAWGRNAVTLDPNFGRIRSTAGSMRQIQFGLKYIF